jgi:hypothetical protein
LPYGDLFKSHTAVETNKYRTEIRMFVNLCPETKHSDIPKLVATFTNLDTRLGFVFDCLSPEIRYANFSTSEDSKIPAFATLWLNGLYRICSMSLHAALVPMFSKHPPHPSIPKKMVRLSAEEVVKQATITLDMATTFLDTGTDLRKLSLTIGYMMLMAVTLHFKSLMAQRKLRLDRVSRSKAALVIIKKMKTYWATLDMLVR